MAALRHRDFRVFWVGSALSGFGSQFTTVAAAWQIYELTDSALQLGLLGLARGAPQLVLLLYGGMLADAVDRRRLMLLTQFGQLAVSVIMAGCTMAGMMSPGVLYGCSLLIALFSSLETPARQAIVPNLVPLSDLTNALALNSTQRQIGMIAGPSLAGLVLAGSGAAFCYWVNAASWITIILALLIMRELPVPTGGRRAPSLQALGEGFQFVWTHPVLLCMMALDFAQNFLVNPRALLPIYARDILYVGPEGLGMLHAANAIGALAMAVVLTFRGQIRRAGLWVLIGVVIYGVTSAIFAVSTVFWVSFLMLAVAGAANAVGAVLRGTINQLATPDELRGRVTGVNSTFTMAGPQLGQFEAGALAAAIGPVAALLAGGVLVTALAAGMGTVAGSVRRFQIGDSSPSVAHQRS